MQVMNMVVLWQVISASFSVHLFLLYVVSVHIVSLLATDSSNVPAN